MVTFIRHYIFKQTVLFVLLVLLFLFATVTRFYQLGQIPHGMTWDEAAIGYNGFAIFTTHRDEWLQRMPISFRSFGDYKAPLAIYINGISTAVFGMNLFAVRFPFALSGLLFIFSFGYFCWLFFADSKNRLALTLFGLFFVVTSPWHLHFSRIGFEAGMALALIMLGIAGLEHLHRCCTSKLKTSEVITLFFSVTCLVASLYTYHSTKIFLPLFGIVLTLRYFKTIVSNRKVLVGAALYGCILVAPLVIDTFFGAGGTRASVLITAQGSSFFELIWVLSKNVMAHFSFDFLLFGNVDSYRHGSGSYGVLSVTTFILGLFALVCSLMKSTGVTNQAKNLLLVAMSWVVIGVLPAALSSEVVPHTNRALLALPGFLLLALIGIDCSLSVTLKKNSELFKRMVIGMVILVESLLFIVFWHSYLTAFATGSAADFEDGYLEAFSEANRYEHGLDGYPEVSQIIVSSQFGQPYIYALFIRHTSPIAYQGGSLNKYLFLDTVSVGDLSRKNALIIATPNSDLPISQATKIVYGSDGTPRFLLYLTDPL